MALIDNLKGYKSPSATINSKLGPINIGGNPLRFKRKTPLVDHLKDGLLEALPYASNIANSFRHLPPPAAPVYEDYKNPALVDFSADRARIDKQLRTATRTADIGISNPAVAAAIKASAFGQAIQGNNQLAQQEGNTNASIINSNNYVNSLIGARNVQRTNDFNQSGVSRNLNQQRLNSENLADLGDKIQLSARDKSLFDLENRKLDILPSMYEDTGVVDRHYLDDILKDKEKLETRAYGGNISIKPSHRGRFTRWAKAHNMSVGQATSRILAAPKGKYSTGLRRMANFSRNFGGN